MEDIIISVAAGVLLEIVHIEFLGKLRLIKNALRLIDRDYFMMQLLLLLLKNLFLTFDPFTVVIRPLSTRSTHRQ